MATENAPPVRDHVATGWGPNACVRDDRWAVHLHPTAPDFAQTARVFDLQADPDEIEDVASRHPEVVQQAARRLAAVTGPLPITFQQYHQRAPGRTMRTFAPLRFRESG